MSLGFNSQAETIVTVVQGDYFVTDDPAVIITTVLGSCISVCLFDSTAHVGGMNHFLLADHGNTASDDLKYGVNAMELLINKVIRAGAERHQLQAKVFGGGRITDHARDIGASNAQFAIEFLDREGIPCLSKSVGGNKARRVRFYPTTGAAKQLLIAETLPVEEKIQPVPKPADDITLF